MNFSTIILASLYIALIYLHICQNPLILQHDIKVACKLAFVLLIITAVHNLNILPLPPELIVIKTVTYGIVSWTLTILIYWWLLAGCHKDLSLKKNNSPEQTK